MPRCVQKKLATSMALLLAVACGPEEAPSSTNDQVMSDIVISELQPNVLLAGSRLIIHGAGFVPSFAGNTELQLSGTLDGGAVDIQLAAQFDDYDELHVDWPGGLTAGMPSDTGTFVGQAVVQADNALDGLRHVSPPLQLSLELATELLPRLDSVQNEALFVNDPIVAHGDGFLLGGSEGSTVAVIEGCFTTQGQSECVPVSPTEISAKPFTPFDRKRAVFPFSPHIAGIKPGSFSGSVRLINRHGAEAGFVEHSSASIDTANELVEPAIFSFTPALASLGQFVDISGGGFVGVAAGEVDPSSSVTSIELSGTFTPEGGEGTSASLSLVPEFVSGQLLRYVLNEEDELGQAVDLRFVAGTFTGTARPVVKLGIDTVNGSSTPVTLGVGHVKQVVWLRFLPTYVESLRHFGLRAADQQVRDRVLQVTRRDYGGINLDFRTEQPTDFKLYSEVEIGGPDPNGIGLLGYDNTPGKDDGNVRLYDKIGGVNALTQQDGYPGYGGVFVESLFSFSTHPGSLATSIEGADVVFDQLFDPFRPDQGAAPAGADELAQFAPLSSGGSCPAGDRAGRIACAIWALGSLIGTTVTHEIAHALGLADPGGSAFHNSGDWPNAVMDSGHARAFLERAEVKGQGPGIFCDHNYKYLAKVLPTATPDPVPMRPECW